MTDEPAAINVANELANERNREAAERRFGFGIGKLATYLDAAGLHTWRDPAHTSRIFGSSFIVVDIFGLLAAIVQHARS